MRFRAVQRGMNTSFDYAVIHFIGLNSATLQDPNPSFGEEVIEFLRKDLSRVTANTPLVVFFHHPLHGTEFCSQYDPDRVRDMLRPYNVMLMLDGHGHSAVKEPFTGFDAVQGGSPFSKDNKGTDGYNIVYVRNKDLYVAYKEVDETSAGKGLEKKKILLETIYPKVSIQSPHPSRLVTEPSLVFQAQIGMSGRLLRDAWFDLDDRTSGALTMAGSHANGVVPLGDLPNGIHFVRANFRDRNNFKYTRSTAFALERTDNAESAMAKWRYHMTGASKATPLVVGGIVYVGANDGVFYALDEQTGKLLWKFDAGGEILTTAAAYKDLVLFGTGNGTFHALDRTGKPAWPPHQCSREVFSSPVVDAEGVVYFGTNGADLVALDAQTGKEVWTNTDARLGIESKPCVSGEMVFFGAWDGYVYCLDRKTGRTIWKQPGPSGQKSTSGGRYYGPADNGPVATPSGVFICDRGYKGGAYGLDGSYTGEISADCAAIGLSADGASLFLRSGRSPVSKVDFGGKPIWKSGVVTGRIPVSPVEVDGTVYVCTNGGTLHALDAGTGATKWKYQVTPRLYVMSGVAAHDGVAFTTGTDGNVTAIRQPR